MFNMADDDHNNSIDRAALWLQYQLVPLFSNERLDGHRP